ncbi:hypothetical protein D3C75_1278440 [compost metagenome]
MPGNKVLLYVEGPAIIKRDKNRIDDLQMIPVGFLELFMKIDDIIVAMFSFVLSII